MSLSHRTFSLAELDDAPRVLNAGEILFSCSDADSIMCLSSLREQLETSVGIWLEVGESYPAALCARDIATLSWLVDLREVVIAGDDAGSQAEVVRAMLSEEEITFSNKVANIVSAYNRPAPPKPIRVWSYEDGSLRSGDELLSPDASGNTFA
jgi:hypothetical protein